MNNKKRIRFRLDSYPATIALLLLYALMLAAATFIERDAGPVMARRIVYHSPVFFLVNALLIANFIMTSLKYRPFKRTRWGYYIIHLGLCLILAGAFTTHLTGREGTLHLRTGEQTNRMQLSPHDYEELPFTLRLVRFEVQRYAGSHTPSSYESTLDIYLKGDTLRQHISVNKTLDIEGYRLFQSSYDKDEGGTILSLNKDTIGRRLTYAGYALLFVGLLLALASPNSRFGRLCAMQKLIPCFLLFFSLSGNATPVDSIGQASAEAFGRMPMLTAEGRIQPVDTYSSEVLRKISRKRKIDGMNPNEFLLDLITYPEQWTSRPIIRQKNKQIAFRHDLPEGFCSYNDLFDSNGHYKLSEELEEAFRRPPKSRSKYDKDLLKLDEKANLLHRLFAPNPLHILPPHAEGLEPNKIEAELIYNKLPIFSICGIAYLVLAILIAIPWGRKALSISRIMLIGFALFHASGLVLRAYISGHAPWANAYETMLCLSLATLSISIWFGRRSPFVNSLGAIMAAILVFVSGLSWMDPRMTPLVPVLNSPWLLFHVAAIIAAYAFFGLSFLIGICNLTVFRKRTAKRAHLTLINEISLYLGTVLMAVGTFLGAIWANQSWGRYWAWDAKETWALITLIVYALVLHLHLLRLDKQRYFLRFNQLSVIAFATVLMTYLGVSYFFGGLHAY